MNLEVGDRVELTCAVSPFSPGAKGIVTSARPQGVKVSIDERADGTLVSPPFALPPQPESCFRNT